MLVDLHPEARVELLTAAGWYDERRENLGDEFIAEVSATLDRIGDNPSAFRSWPGTSTTALKIRRAVIKRFPYLIAFETHTQRVLVLAVAHAKRRPLYWLRRAL